MEEKTKPAGNFKDRSESVIHKSVPHTGDLCQVYENISIKFYMMSKTIITYVDKDVMLLWHHSDIFPSAE